MPLLSPWDSMQEGKNQGKYLQEKKVNGWKYILQYISFFVLSWRLIFNNNTTFLNIIFINLKYALNLYTTGNVNKFKKSLCIEENIAQKCSYFSPYLEHKGVKAFIFHQMCTVNCFKVCKWFISWKCHSNLYKVLFKHFFCVCF